MFGFYNVVVLFNSKETKAMPKMGFTVVCVKTLYMILESKYIYVLKYN